MRKIALLALLCVNTLAATSVHLECDHDMSSGLVWQWGGLLKKQGFTAMSGTEGREKITLVIGEERVFLRGNLGQSVLIRVGDYYLEPTADGNITMWRYFPKANDIPPYLFQTVTVPMFGVPSTSTSAWRCREITAAK